MANKAISELPQAQNVNNQDLFVLEQGGLAKKLPAETFITEQGIINALAEALDGHGGIQSVTLSSVSGRIRTYLITFTDGSATTFQVYDGTSIDRISRTSSSGLDDVYTIFLSDGTTTFFTVHNGADGDVSEAMLNDALKDKAPAITETTESGAIATFSDGADDMVMHNIVAEINPVQDLSNGDPSPTNICPISGHTEVTVTRAGKNLLRNQGTTATVSNVLYTVQPDGSVTTSGTSNGWNRFNLGNQTLPPGDYILSSGVSSGNQYNLYLSATINGITYETRNGSVSFSLSEETTFDIGIFTRPGTAPNQIVYPMIRLAADSDSTFAPFVAIDIYSIAFSTEAGTVYGGTIDVATGLLTVTHGLVDLGTLNYGYNSGYGFYVNRASSLLPASAKAFAVNTMSSAVCTSFKTETYADTVSGNYPLSIGIGTSFIGISDTRYTDAATFKTAMNGVILCYELATPQTYQLTPQEVKTLLGTNNVWADTGNVSVTYAADTKMFIEKLTMPTEDDLVANQAITSGQYFMIGNSLYLALANIASGAQITIGTNAQRVSLADALNTINS